MLRISLYLTIIFIVNGCIKKPKTADELHLDGQWVLSGPGIKNELSLNFPVSIHNALLENGLITDPFRENYSDSNNWVSSNSWTLAREFTIPKEWDGHENIELVFNGIDTYAEIFLNDSQIGISENMFVPFEVAIKDRLLDGPNKLLVIIRDPEAETKKRYGKWPYKFPSASGNKGWNAGAFARKAGYHFGWDWAPAMVPAGIYQPVVLRAWTGARILGIQVSTDFNQDLSSSSTCELTLTASEPGSYQIGIQGAGITPGFKKVALQEGPNQVQMDLDILNPKLWWPVGMGDQHLYHIKASLYQNLRKIDSTTQSFGICKSALKREKDSVGESFFFEVNGKPVFAKGGNMVPLDIFLDRVTVSDYEALVKKVKKANFNMLRVWGGGVYGPNEFYSICDREGIMVWQDFMFANTLYPWDPSFQKNVEKEVRYQVERLRNHPSIVLWCGNNEIETAWKNWGWSSSMGLNSKDSILVKSQYTFMFDSLIPGIIKIHDPSRSYLSSSPSSNWSGRDQYNKGNMHDWSVWHGEMPIENWLKIAPRFNTEFGMQSLPSMNLLRKYSSDSTLSNKDFLASRQLADQGERRLTAYLANQFRTPQNLDQLVYISQYHQAMAVGEAAEFMRMSSPDCMGTLIWQVNDGWPGISWSALDFELNEKPLLFRLGKAYDQVMVYSSQSQRRLKIQVINERSEPLSAKAVVQRINFFGTVFSTDSIPFELGSGQKITLHERYLGAYLDSGVGRYTFFNTRIFEGTAIIHEDNHFMEKPKYIWLRDPKIETSITKSDGEFKILLSSEFLAKEVWLEATNIDGTFSQNYFDLIPGRKTELVFSPENLTEQENLKFKITSLNDFR